MYTQVLRILSRGAGHRAWIRATGELGEARRLMEVEGVDHLAVLEGHAVRGVLSASGLDRCRRCLDATGALADATPVERVMTRAVTTAGPEMGIAELLSRMALARSEFAVVIERDRFVGLLPLWEVCSAAARDLDDRVDELTRYICGSPGVEARQTSRARAAQRT